MGQWFSCCRRQRSSEREPLLADVPQEQIPPPQSRLDKLVDAFAAINAGKLPSQAQLTKILQLFVNFLRKERNGTTPLRGYKGPLSGRGRKLVADVQDIAEAMLQIGMQFNCTNDVPCLACIFY
jgi:hypothetical protein